MSLKQWTPVLLVIGVSALMRPPGHDGATEPRHVGGVESPAAIGEAPGPYRTVELDVTGMA